MNPELQAIQKKYKNKRDQESMLKMQEEMKMVYDKYGTSQMGGCLQLLIQFPILLALWKVIQNIPAYVGGVRNTRICRLLMGSWQQTAISSIEDRFGKSDSDQSG